MYYLKGRVLDDNSMIELVERDLSIRAYLYMKQQLHIQNPRPTNTIRLGELFDEVKNGNFFNYQRIIDQELLNNNDFIKHLIDCNSNIYDELPETKQREIRIARYFIQKSYLSLTKSLLNKFKKDEQEILIQTYKSYYLNTPDILKFKNTENDFRLDAPMTYFDRNIEYSILKLLVDVKNGNFKRFKSLFHFCPEYKSVSVAKQCMELNPDAFLIFPLYIQKELELLNYLAQLPKLSPKLKEYLRVKFPNTYREYLNRPEQNQRSLELADGNDYTFEHLTTNAKREMNNALRNAKPIPKASYGEKKKYKDLLDEFMNQYNADVAKIAKIDAKYRKQKDSSSFLENENKSDACTTD